MDAAERLEALQAEYKRIEEERGKVEAHRESLALSEQRLEELKGRVPEWGTELLTALLQNQKATNALAGRVVRLEKTALQTIEVVNDLSRRLESK